MWDLSYQNDSRTFADLMYEYVTAETPFLVLHAHWYSHLCKQFHKNLHLCLTSVSKVFVILVSVRYPHEYDLILILMVLSGQKFCPPIYPFGNQLLEFAAGVPLFSLYCLQTTPSPSPPKFASKTVITCQPLTVHRLYITVKHVCLAFSA